MKLKQILAGKGPAAEGLDPDVSVASRRLFTPSSFPVRYLVIPKCGCTFVKNVLWFLDHGRVHADPHAIHDQDRKFGRPSALGLTDADIEAEEYAFTVIRNPVDRLFSLYSDKVIGERHAEFIPLRDVLVRHYGVDPETTTTEGHRANLYALMDFMEGNLRDKLHLPHDAHWTPQIWRKPIMQAGNLKMLTLNDLNEQLELLLAPLIPDIADVLVLSEKNRYGGSFNGKQAILDGPLRERISGVFEKDKKLFFAVKRRWEKVWESDDPWSSIPRFRDFPPRLTR